MNSPLLDKSLDFATQIVLFYEEFSKNKKDTTIAKQLLRSAKSIYWLKLLKNTKLFDYDFESLLSLADEIKRMLIASLNTAKENSK